MTTQPRRDLPIGTQTFRKIRRGNYYYVDKTAYARRLAFEGGGHYFLSRPRRFGKSLFLDTLKEMFEGNEQLFCGLAIHDEWDWSVRHPVLRLSFARGNYSEPGYLQKAVMVQLKAIERRAGLPAGDDTMPATDRFAALIESLYETTGQEVVVLVDEYDKPILDALSRPEIVTANRGILRGLYGALKDSDTYIRLSFLTGVSTFAKVSLSSDLNHLNDLTLDPRFSALCGYTEADLDEVFAPELAAMAKPGEEERERTKIRKWYNGYCWLGDETVCSPYDILFLFDKGRCDPWWLETSTPKFLVDVLRERPIRRLDLERKIESLELLSRFDVGGIAPEALLFQAGYLTITGTETVGEKTHYSLGYPNQEVRESLNRFLVESMPHPSRPITSDIRNGHST